MTRQALVAGAAVLALAALPVPPAAAETEADGHGTAALLAELRVLYRDTGEAAHAYNEADRLLNAQREEAAELTERLAAARTELAGARGLAGRLAASQYRHGDGIELPPTLRLLLGEDPGRALHNQTVADRAAAAQVAEIEKLIEGERRADELATGARAALDAQQALAEDHRHRRDEVHRRLDEVAGLLAGLSAEEVAALGDSETAAAAEAGATGDFQDDGRPPSAAGERALAYALERLGEPHADPAALVRRAWERAGRSIPRTGAEQWRELPRVPMAELRPGDVVLYFADASHPALYAGRGMVVHAPGPGAGVELAPLDVHPVLGAVRPDQAAGN